MPYFRFPRPIFPYNYQYTPHYKPISNTINCNNTISKSIVEKDTIKEKNNPKENEIYFFELFGLKLYFDDVLLICLILFLYQEGVKDDELFISLILLLLS